jgi:hypothetical protein
VKTLLPGGLFLVSLGPGCARDDGARAIAEAAAAFVQSLGPGEREKAVAPFDSPQRTEWGFVPAEYPGLVLKDMDAGQRRAAHALLRASLSSQGYLKATAVFALDAVLRALEEQAGRQAPHRDPERYWFQVLGDPGGDQPWGWRVQGHHVSLHFTTAGGVVAHSPFFLGANPAEVRSGATRGLRVLGAEEDLGRRLWRSLDEGQRQQALLAVKAPADVILGPGRKADFLGPPKGLPVGAMDEAQRGIAALLLDEYVHNLRREVAERSLRRIRAAGVDQIRFAWAGGDEPGQGHYYRLHGPTFVVEYDNTQNGANHVHTVWRDLTEDFGEDLLRQHHEREHRRR